MSTKDDAKKIVFQVLKNLFQEYKDKGLLSIYLWGSVISDDFNPDLSDVDAVGILSDKADFKKMEEIREWLPTFEKRLNRLQINFFYLSELEGFEPVRSRLARLHNSQQAVFDFPNWEYVIGRHFKVTDFPKVTPQKALQHQAALAQTKMNWAMSGKYGDVGLEYFCKGLAWLCYDIHKLSSPPNHFSWSGLRREATTETRELVETLAELKSKHWDTKAIEAKMPYLMNEGRKLIAKYKG